MEITSNGGRRPAGIFIGVEDEEDDANFKDELLDQVGTSELVQRVIKTSGEVGGEDHITTGQGLIMSLDFHEPAIAIGNYYRIE
jgi:hypothetical protein